MTPLLERIEIDLGNNHTELCVHVDIYDTSLSRRWLTHLNDVLAQNLHLEKNYCFLGFSENLRNGRYLYEQIQRTVDRFKTVDLPGIDLTTPYDYAEDPNLEGLHAYCNHLHRLFEHCQGVHGALSPVYESADAETRWHIRQLNLLCHEYESWCLSWRKQREAPEWQRPSQLMCWLNSPRFALAPEDLDLFGIETINRTLGGIYVGVNKAVGKHHWEVFQDEGRDSRIGELITTTLTPQTLAAADFDIEWARNPGAYVWQQENLAAFRTWLVANGFDPEDPALTIGHPKIGQVDLLQSFGTEDYREIWRQLNMNLNVRAIRTTTHAAEYPYSWQDPNYMEQQILCLGYAE
jgi:hypothetical protein